MKKNVVKINENALRQIVAESVKKVLKENDAYENLANKGVQLAGDLLQYLKDLENAGYAEEEPEMFKKLMRYVNPVHSLLMAIPDSKSNSPTHAGSKSIVDGYR